MTRLARAIEPVPGFPGYLVSNGGEVYSTRRYRDAVLLTPNIVRGYPQVTLYRDGKRSYKKVSRLVLEVFVGPCSPGKEACHNDGVRTNNCVENLRWDTRKNNDADRDRHGTRIKGLKHSKTKLTIEQVAEIRRCKADAERNGQKAWGCRRLAREYGISVKAVFSVGHGINWRTS